MGDAKQLVEIKRVFLAKAVMRPQSQVGQNFLNDVGLVNEGRGEAVRRVRRLRGWAAEQHRRASLGWGDIPLCYC